MTFALFGIENDGLNLAVNLLVFFLVVIWVALVCVILCLPQFNWGTFGEGEDAITIKFIDVFNFTPVIVVGLFIIIGLWYALSARKWFTGPKVMGTPEELAAIEAELEGLG